MFTGTFTAIVTPFHQGQLDEDALVRLVRSQVKGGVSGVVPVGTTGESPTLDFDEHIRVVELTVKTVAGRIPVIAGTGANSTREAIELTQRAEAAGADASLQVAPYYNKPTQEGLYQHFRAIAHNTRLPLMLYSIPGRVEDSEAMGRRRYARGIQPLNPQTGTEPTARSPGTRRLKGEGRRTPQEANPTARACNPQIWGGSDPRVPLRPSTNLST